MKTTMAEQVENYLKSIEDEGERFSEAHDIIFSAVNQGANNYLEGLGILEDMKFCYKEAHEYAIEQEKQEKQENQKVQHIIVWDYPNTFEFTIKEKLPKFRFGCHTRTRIAHQQLEKQQIESPNHEYSDYIVEKVYPWELGEIWDLGS